MSLMLHLQTWKISVCLVCRSINYTRSKPNNALIIISKLIKNDLYMPTEFFLLRSIKYRKILTITIVYARHLINIGNRNIIPYDIIWQNWILTTPVIYQRARVCYYNRMAADFHNRNNLLIIWSNRRCIVVSVRMRAFEKFYNKACKMLIKYRRAEAANQVVWAVIVVIQQTLIISRAR